MESRQESFFPLVFSSPVNQQQDNRKSWKNRSNYRNNKNSTSNGPYRFGLVTDATGNNYSPLHSFNNSIPSAGQCVQNQQGRDQSYTRRISSKNINAYYHPSMLENPWDQLERNLSFNKSNDSMLSPFSPPDRSSLAEHSTFEGPPKTGDFAEQNRQPPE